ncbi:MAG: hypothetical protein ACREQ5_08995, partial [Candidatus Dormibacteria bacterium]
MSVKIVRWRFRRADGNGRDARGFDGNYIILILKNTFDPQKALAIDDRALFLVKIRIKCLNYRANRKWRRGPNVIASGRSELRPDDQGQVHSHAFAIYAAAGTD